MNLLRKNIKHEQLKSFNKTRKVLDLYFEHLVALDSRFTKTEREKLSGLLFLPLDSWIIKNDFVFSSSERKELKLNMNYTFSCIRTLEHYYEIQNYLKENLKGLEHRIYFDLFWKSQYKNTNAKNLIELHFRKIK